jgi:UV DNA damage endonuclease
MYLPYPPQTLSYPPASAARYNGARALVNIGLDHPRPSVDARAPRACALYYLLRLQATLLCNGPLVTDLPLSYNCGRTLPRGGRYWSRDLAMRLGFAVKVLGQPGLKSHDTRRWQNDPHLSVSLAYLRDIFLYLERQDIHMYRLAADLAPYVTHPDLPQFHSQIEECATELTTLGEMASELDLRLSFHLPLVSVLNAEDERVARQTVEQAGAHAKILDGLALGPEAVIVAHVGGVYGDKERALARFVERYESLPMSARRRLVLENDDKRFSVADIAWVSRETGIPLVFDLLHHLNHNPQDMAVLEALDTCLRTWPAGVRPKVHFSSPRTAMRIIERKGSARGTKSLTMRAPRPHQHADFVDPFRFVDFIEEASRYDLAEFDVMLEAKGKDLALLHLREELARLAPDVTVE